MYDYRYEVKEAVKEFIRDNYDSIALAEFADADEFAEHLNDELWTEDSVTGNASGSYFCNAWKAEECLAHNWDLIEEVAEEFGIEPTISSGYEHGAEWWDVTIRCYLLGEAIGEALDEMNLEFGDELGETA